MRDVLHNKINGTCQRARTAESSINDKSPATRGSAINYKDENTDEEMQSLAPTLTALFLEEGSGSEPVSLVESSEPVQKDFIESESPPLSLPNFLQLKPGILLPDNETSQKLGENAGPTSQPSSIFGKQNPAEAHSPAGSDSEDSSREVDTLNEDIVCKPEFPESRKSG